MELVATAKFGRIKNKFANVDAYYKNIENLYYNLIRNTNQDIDAILNSHAWSFKQKRNLYIVFGSDLGLCGSYNSEMLKTISKTVADDDLLIVVGSKLLNLINKVPQLHVIQTLTQIGDDPNYDIALLISKKIYDVLQISLLNSVKLIYTQYINPIKATPIVQDIYPISQSSLDAFCAGAKFEPIDTESFEPNAEVILQNSFLMYFEASIYYALTSSKLAETSQRRTSMEQASDNAEDLIKELKIKYNSSRQAKITQEITEIVNGANS